MQPTKTDTTSRTRTRFAAGVAATLVALSLTGVASADNPRTLGDVAKTRAVGSQTAPDGTVMPQSAVEAEKIRLAEQWGIEVTSIRMSVHGHMIDFRYRVLDPVKAKELFVRQNKPSLIHQDTGKVLAVPETAKVGPLRNSNTPQEGKIYWMFFGNAGSLVQSGDRVTVVIGDFRVEDLLVE